MKILSLTTSVVLCGLLAMLPSACVSQKENKVAGQDYLSYVDPYIGSGEHGHVFVGASVPLGMVQRLGRRTSIKAGTGARAIIIRTAC